MIKVTESIVATTGENITLTCEASGYPPPFISWMRNLEPISTDSRYSLSSKNGLGTLQIQNAQVVDGGDYNCVIVSTLYGTTVVQPSVRVDIIRGKCTDQ